ASGPGPTRAAGPAPANGLAELVDRAVERGRVQLAGRVLAERGEVADRERLPPRPGRQLRARGAQAPDRAVAVVAVEVAPARGGDGLAAVDVAAGDRAALGGMAVDDDREDERAVRVHLLAGRVARAALPDAPAVVVQPA